MPSLGEGHQLVQLRSVKSVSFINAPADITDCYDPGAISRHKVRIVLPGISKTLHRDTHFFQGVGNPAVSGMNLGKQKLRRKQSPGACGFSTAVLTSLGDGFSRVSAKLRNGYMLRSGV